MTSAFSVLVKPAHMRSARMLGYALSGGDFNTWEAASTVWAARLTPQERLALAFASLRALDPDDAQRAAEAALDGGAGPPIPPLFNYMDEAAFWADLAEPDELKAYVLASFTRLSPRAQADFLAYVRGRAAA